MDALSTPREKSSSLSHEQKRTLVNLIAVNKVVLDKSDQYYLISKKREAWEKIAENYNAAHPIAEMKTSQQLKRAWEYLRNRVKSDFATYSKKKRQTGGGPPPTPPKYDPLLEAVSSLVKNELLFSEYQYDNTCTEVPTPPSSAASPYPDAFETHISAPPILMCR
ncbi:uncharacterized protein LOC126995264 [Eriocheir sinensis]|uniref:uncharacterized protein LOC126995264 n=1 Tax=Eriocheir sinensis TaxID=95602 RepID=UPI0021C7E2DF|nr:uncharacterized protein LOC126995264 [Eriocheir sinensis]